MCPRKRPSASAAPLSAEPATGGDTPAPVAPGTSTRLLRSASFDYPEVLAAIVIGLDSVAEDLGVNPASREWAEVVPYIVGVFNIGRALALRSVGRAFAGETDPAEWPANQVELEIDPGRGARWQYAEGVRWTRPA